MKKVYAKPQIMFEDFSLSTSIAAGCKVFTNLGENICGIEDPVFGMVFTDLITGCETTGQDKFCYDVPVSSNELFVS